MEKPGLKSPWMLRTAALALLMLVQGCGSTLQPWHTEELTEEFTAAKADEVRTFDDYRQLEDRLLAQLDETVYARVETGPDHQLVRYSAGSAADPRGRQPDWNRSYELRAEAPVGGVLLLHGMADSPYTLRALGEALQRHGYQVVGLRLPGHGTAPSGIRVVHRLTRSVDRRLAALARSGAAEILPPTLVLKSTVDATVTTAATVDGLLMRLPPHRDELVLFDINRAAIATTPLVADPGPLTDRLMTDGQLPFGVTIVTNEPSGTLAVVARHKAPFSTEVADEHLDLEWPGSVVSLSHMALPVPPDDPLYGRYRPEDRSVLFLGEMAIRGEPGVVKLPAAWLLRTRYNPFYAIVEQRMLDWLERAGHPRTPPAPNDGASRRSPGAAPARRSRPSEVLGHAHERYRRAAALRRRSARARGSRRPRRAAGRRASRPARRAGSPPRARHPRRARGSAGRRRGARTSGGCTSRARGRRPARGRAAPHRGRANGRRRTASRAGSSRRSRRSRSPCSTTK